MRKITNKEIIADMLLEEMNKSDGEYKTIKDVIDHIEDVRSVGHIVDSKIYILYVAYKYGLSGLRKYCKHFEKRIQDIYESTFERIKYYKELCSIISNVTDRIKYLNSEDEPLPF